MGNIFGDTDDITFGGQAPIPRERTTSSRNTTPERETSRPRERTRPVASQSDRPTYRPRPTASPVRPPVTETKTTNLRRLIEGMKPSYLPQTDDSYLRVIPLSLATELDPLFLMRKGDQTLLLGTGFSTLSNAGSTYQTFPDMRLPYSEKDRLAGWVLLTPGFDTTLFSTILETLGFPFVYGTRDVIAYIRNNITDTVFLEKCRFFELFSPGEEVRKIGDFSLEGVRSGSIVISVGSSGCVDSVHGTPSSAPQSSSFPEMKRNDEAYVFGAGEGVVPGEIIEISGKTLKRNPLKFTFDTFYVDRESIGVVAGYTLKDRKELSENGILTFVLEEGVRSRAIVGHIFIDSRGFVHSYEMMSVHKEVLKGIRQTYEQTIIAHPRIERGELVSTLRREITKYCYLVTGRTPVVMPIIIER